MGLPKLPLTVINGSLRSLRHPLRTASGVVSVGRSLVAGVVTGQGRSGQPTPAPAERAEPAPPRKDQGDALDLTPADLEAEPPGTPGEPHDEVVTEPSAPTGPDDLEEVPPPTRTPEDEDTAVTTPVGTTGADVAHNPDTTDTDLQQPGTEPLMDPSTTKRIKKETDTLRKAADPDKG